MGVRKAGRQSRMASLGPDLRLQFVYHLHNNAQEQPFSVPFQNSLGAPSREHSWGRGGKEEVLAREVQSGESVPAGWRLWILGSLGPPRQSPLRQPLWDLVGARFWVSGQTCFLSLKMLFEHCMGKKKPWTVLESRHRSLCPALAQFYLWPFAGKIVLLRLSLLISAIGDIDSTCKSLHLWGSPGWVVG